MDDIPNGRMESVSGTNSRFSSRMNSGFWKIENIPERFAQIFFVLFAPPFLYVTKKTLVELIEFLFLTYRNWRLEKKMIFYLNIQIFPKLLKFSEFHFLFIFPTLFIFINFKLSERISGNLLIFEIFAEVFFFFSYVPEGNMTSCGTDYFNQAWLSRSYILVYSIFVYYTPLFTIIYSYWFIVSVSFQQLHRKGKERLEKLKNKKIFLNSRRSLLMKRQCGTRRKRWTLRRSGAGNRKERAPKWNSPK